MQIQRYLFDTFEGAVLQQPRSSPARGCCNTAACSPSVPFLLRYAVPSYGRRLHET